ncbi:putative membrane protein YesL [Streptohalobacillus salinus]|uniref:Putative membrane protein YesL n=1 Tax=Streptohalobacillus salinus TaxID=621096 RepID=A0A2V3WFU7_9BACI|nr:DUF624 domain-containing protein [Streptohalobacillus salinus]PXW92156.1 putative membrane protein YesL [Streptohalobacillus salinus]
MKSSNVMTTLEKVLNYIALFAMLNILWLSLTLLGVVIFGFFPATVALLYVMRKHIETPSLNYLIKVKLFWKSFKKEFIKANLTGWILVIIGTSFYVNYQLLLSLGSEVVIAVPIIFIVLLSLFAITIVWVFPLMIYTNGTIIQNFRNAIILAISKIHISAIVLFVVFASLYISLDFPALFLFFTFSIISLIWTYFCLSNFKKIKFQ